MHRVAGQATFPVREERTGAHALRVCFEGERGGAVGFAGGLDVDDGLAGWDGVCGRWEADFLEVGFGDGVVC